MPYGKPIGLGLFAGVLARVLLLRSDYRQYPTYPHGYTSHLFLGIIAALVGAVSIPALLTNEWTAVTFLVLVAQQFRDIRSMERDSLKALEDTQLVTRGADYIENIARVFETRYYVVIFVAVSTAWGSSYGSAIVGLLLGAASLGLSMVMTKVEHLGRSVLAEIAPVVFRDAGLYVGDIFIMNVGLEESRLYISCLLYTSVTRVPGTVFFGGAGAFDSSVLSAILAVGLVELVGEAREKAIKVPGGDKRDEV